jgi:hypothetical protein
MGSHGGMNRTRIADEPRVTMRIKIMTTKWISSFTTGWVTRTSEALRSLPADLALVKG